MAVMWPWSWVWSWPSGPFWSTDCSIRSWLLRRRHCSCGCSWECLRLRSHRFRGVDPLDLADELERAVDVSFRVGRIAEHERKLGHDPVAARFLSHLQRLVRRRGTALIHPLERLV